MADTEPTAPPSSTAGTSPPPDMETGMSPPSSPWRGPHQTVRPTATEVFKTFVPTAPPTEQEPCPEAEVVTKRPPFLTPVLHVALVLGLVTALFAAAQAAVLYNQIALLPGWLRPMGYALLIVVGVVLLSFGGKFVWRYGRLRVSPRLNRPLDEDLQERERARQQLRTERVAEARQTLTRFLTAYPLRPVDLAELSKRSLEPMALDALRAAQHSLTGSSAPKDDREWLRRFEHEFLGPLDHAAGQQTWRHMQAVGLFTATASRGALDALAVLVVSYKLVEDLCTIYHVRAGRWGTAVILAHIVVNLVTASQLDTVADTVESSFDDWLHSTVETGAATVAGIAGRLFGKAAEGSANALLLRRLSVRTQAYLRPLRTRPAAAPAQPGQV